MSVWETKLGESVLYLLQGALRDYKAGVEQKAVNINNDANSINEYLNREMKEGWRYKDRYPKANGLMSR